MLPSGATSVYKVIEANGAVTFTDVNPHPEVNKSTAVPADGTAEVDEAVAIANEQVDRAEHELAQARQKIESQGLSLAAERKRLDVARVDLCKKNVRIAHQQLAEALASARKRATSATS